MDSITLLQEVKLQAPEASETLISLYELFQQIPDRRFSRGKRYDLARLLALVVFAKLAGINSLLAISEWITYQEEMVRQALDIAWKRLPCANTYRYALAHVWSEQVQILVADWLRRRSTQVRWQEKVSGRELGSREAHQHIAVDGKVLKGTGKQIYGGEAPQEKVLEVYEVQTGIVLHQRPIPATQNEVSALKPLLTEVLCRGRILTADAAQSYHDFGRLVQRAGGEVIVMIKHNTPVTREDLELFFEDPQADRSTWETFGQREKGHGRVEYRHITTSPDLNSFLFREWGEVGQVFRIQRERVSSRKQTCEIHYGWTSLSKQECSAPRLLALIRSHWAIENRLHWRRDVLLREDACTVRLAPVAQMLAVLNSLVLSLMDLHQISRVAQQMRRFSASPSQALAWLLDF